MAQPRKYESQAAKQAAYRARKAAAPSPSTGKAPGYAKWRKAIQDAYRLLDDTREELAAWMEERSERWQDSDRGGEMEADRDSLSEILDRLDDLHLRQR